MEDATPANTPPATIQTPAPETSKPEPEVANITVDLKAAQAAVNRMKLIIEAALSCLLEQRLKYPIVKIGILEAYLPQRKIEVLTSTTTLATILIAGLGYLKYYGLPSTGEERLLGKCSFIKLDPKAEAREIGELPACYSRPSGKFPGPLRRVRNL